MFRLRDALVTEFGFAIPCIKALKTIKKYADQGIVEVGAGTGYWTQLLKGIKVDCIATDSQTGEYPFKHNTEVEKLDAVSAVRKYYPRNVLMVWPCYDHPWAYQTALELKVGQTLIFIGDGRGGCTADDSFFSLMSTECFVMKDRVAIPQWDGIHDYIQIYECVKTPVPVMSRAESRADKEAQEQIKYEKLKKESDVRVIEENHKQVELFVDYYTEEE
jgi:hypothetical protein